MIPTLNLDLLLATTGQGDPLDKILPWVTTFVAMVLAAVFKVQADKAKAMRLEEPVPTVPTRKVPGLVTWNDLQAVVERIARQEQHTLRLEQKLDEMSSEQAEQYRDILTAGSNRQMELVNHMDAIARAIHSRIDEMMQHKSTTRR